MPARGRVARLQEFSALSWVGMNLACIRRFAWLLILVLVTGLAMPVLASATPCDSVQAVSAHTHADGSTHSHAIRIGNQGVGQAADRHPIKSHHCTDCLMGAACAVSCLGLAVLPVTSTIAAPSSAVSWNTEASHVLPSVAPSGDIDPPRPVLHS